MADKLVNLELLLGKRIDDESGKPVGHIQEIHVRRQGKDWVVEEYMVGAVAFLERFAALTILDGLLKRFRGGEQGGYIIPWDKLDLSDPEHPRLLGRKQELKPLEPEAEQEREQKKEQAHGQE